MYLSGRIAGMIVAVRTVCFVAGAGVASPVGRLMVAASPQAVGATALASAWSSSRSQLAAHAGFVFERGGNNESFKGTNI